MKNVLSLDHVHIWFFFEWLSFNLHLCMAQGTVFRDSDF